MMKQLAILIFSAVICFQQGFVNGSLNDMNNNTDALEYVLLNEENPCARTCIKGAPPMVCKFTFTMEWYHSLSKACYDCPYVTSDCFRKHCISLDGNKRPVLVINRQIPGPNVEVCVGDEVVIDVQNHLLGESTTIHWHGHHQRGTPYMDGVPLVTQCPISPGSTFRYHFRAVNAGTHFWHSHIGFQRVDGAFGGFVVRAPEEDDPHYQLYDYDLSSHVMVLADWNEEIGSTKFLAHHHSNGNNKPSTLLVNGMGRMRKYYDENNATIYTPTSRFVVEQGYRYRFRVIHAGYLNCPIEISVDNHTLTAISSDGNNFLPLKAESIVIYDGERFDFILNADQPKGLYWMRFRGLMDCDERFNSAHQSAVLQYKGLSSEEYPAGPEPDYEHSHKEGLQLNGVNKGTEQNVSVCMPQLKSADKWELSLKETPDFKYYVGYDFYQRDNPHFHNPAYYAFHDVRDAAQQLLTPQFNNISMKYTPFPLLSGRNHIKEGMLCNESTVQNCDVNFCECTHVVQVPLNAVVEMFLIDQGRAFDANHPLHLHGTSFRVVAMEKLGKSTTRDEVMRRDAAGLIKRNLINAPLKDTVTVPDGGYTVIRFVASNPGYWLFHCHIEFHVEVGMAIVFKFGEDSDMPPIPKDFPTCGNYLEDQDLPELPGNITDPLGNSSNGLFSYTYNLITAFLAVFLLLVNR